MSDKSSKRLDPRAEALKRMLKLVRTRPQAFFQVSLYQPSVLRRLIPHDHDHIVETAQLPVEQAHQSLERFVLSRLVKAIETGEDARALIQGGIILWYTYLDRSIRSNRTIPSVREVLVYCLRETVSEKTTSNQPGGETASERITLNQLASFQIPI